ncbi:MAG: hypothetical protein LBQ54_10065 [Planctomycetaceae bacterium]|nr:hypothetical protein [Planctomycetaceae bacterium]
MEDEPLLTDLIPKRLGTYWLIFLFGTGFIAGLEYCFAGMPSWASEMNVESITAFDLSQSGNLHGWFASILWLVASLYAAIIYKVNRREDDWRRLGDIWIWVALLTFFLSVDRASGLHLAFRDFMIYATGTQLFDSGMIWWASIYGILFIMVGSRILVEMRRYLPACNALLVCGLCHIITLCASVNVIFSDNPVKKMMVLSASDMLGNLFLVISFGLYGRRLILGDFLAYRNWNLGFWGRLTHRSGSPYGTSYASPDYSEDYGESNPSRRRQRRHPVQTVRTANSTWVEEEEEEYPQREPHYRQRRLKKSQRGVFY